MKKIFGVVLTVTLLAVSVSAQWRESLEKGSNGETVAQMQERLIELGYLNSPADGDYGTDTENAVKSFQTANGLEATGVLDELSLALLSHPVRSGAPLEYGSRGEAVKKAQEKLIEMGYLGSAADGIFGSDTRNAVTAFQTASGLEATGVLDQEAMDLLYGVDRNDAQEEEQTEEETEILTEEETEALTEEETEALTEEETEALTEEETEALTEEETEALTEEETEALTEEETEALTEEETEALTEEETEALTEEETEALTEEETEETTEAAVETATAQTDIAETTEYAAESTTEKAAEPTTEELVETTTQEERPNILNYSDNPLITTKSNYVEGIWRTASLGTGVREIVDVNWKEYIKGFHVTATTSDAGPSDLGVDEVPVEFGKDYILSCYAKGTGKVHLMTGKGVWQDTEFDVTDAWEKYEYPFTVGVNDGSTQDSPYTNVYFGASNAADSDLIICGMKLEEAGE